MYMCIELLPPGGYPIAVNPLNAELNPIYYLLVLLARPGRLIPEARALVPSADLDLREEKNLSSQQEIEPRFRSFSARSLEAQSYIRQRNLIPQVS
jgi:hypothetical protein